MQQHSQVIPVDAEAPADLVLLAFLEKQPVQELALLLRQSSHDGPDMGTVLVQAGGGLGVDARVRQCGPGLLLERRGLRVGAIHLEQDVVADAVDERAEAAGGLNAPGLPKRFHDPEKRLLPRILNVRRRPQARSQLDREQIPEVAREMALGLWIS